jgi:hypothetical protein
MERDFEGQIVCFLPFAMREKGSGDEGRNLN